MMTYHSQSHVDTWTTGPSPRAETTRSNVLKTVISALGIKPGTSRYHSGPLPPALPGPTYAVIARVG